MCADRGVNGISTIYIYIVYLVCTANDSWLGLTFASERVSTIQKCCVLALDRCDLRLTSVGTLRQLSVLSQEETFSGVLFRYFSCVAEH